MPQLFLFCIGGTGARVLKSLIFLLAAGVDIKARKVIPIIIDPDAANGDVQRTITLLKLYQDIRNRLSFERNRFFATEIQTLASLESTASNGDQTSIPDSYRWDIEGTRDGLFKRFIGYDNLDVINRDFINLLFSEKNLNAELSVGFKGNPHMGSVVLNQFRHSKEFKYFASHFNEGDRVFIVSSIFGGTGAAGFPLLVKNIREATEDLSNHTRLRNAPLGALTVLPYFGVEPEAGIAIDKTTFISKTKAALEYYHDNLSGNNSLNALYYLGDRVSKDYKPAEGRAEQRNDAHAIELFAALATIDFMDLDSGMLQSNNGRAIEPIYKEYGVKGDDRVLTFKNLGRKSHRQIAGPLSQYAYSVNYWRNHLAEALGKPANWARSRTTPFGMDFLNSNFYEAQLRPFNNMFVDWLVEMARNERALAPFNLDTNYPDGLVQGYASTKKNLFGKTVPDNWGYPEYDAILDTVEKDLPEQDHARKFMTLFYQGTAEILRRKFSELATATTTV